MTIESNDDGFFGILHNSTLGGMPSDEWKNDFPNRAESLVYNEYVGRKKCNFLHHRSLISSV
jgi:hypothetical protein